MPGSAVSGKDLVGPEDSNVWDTASATNMHCAATAVYTEELKALAGTGDVRVVGGLQTGAMGSFALDWADMSGEAVEWLQSGNGRTGGAGAPR